MPSLFEELTRFTVSFIQQFWSEKQNTTMDTQIVNWEMSLESEQSSIPQEGIASWPSEPYTLDWEGINWN